MIKNAAASISYTRDKVVVNPVNIKKKTGKLKRIKNKTSKNIFIFIITASLLTALIALNIVLYLNVNKLQDMNSSENKTLEAVEEILKSKNVSMRNEIIDNHDRFQNKIEKSVEQIQIEVTDKLKEFENGIVSIKQEFKTEIDSIKKEIKKEIDSIKKEIKKEIDSIIKGIKDNLELEKRGISNSVHDLKKETTSNIATIRNEILSMSKKLDDFILLRSGIQNNVHVSKLTTSGFMYVYNKPYHNATKVSEMEAIKASCLPTTILCLGGRHIVDDVLVVVSCGSCFVVLTKTEKNTPNFNNGAYWYYSPNVEKSRSMGFAPSSKILQDNADRFDLGNNQRVSWQLDNVSNGYRLGSMIDLDIFRYYKVILKKDF
jgi:hypothetical protein